jgi:hypothetical protein
VNAGLGSSLVGGSGASSFVAGPGDQTGGYGLSSTFKALLGRDSLAASGVGRSVFEFSKASVGGLFAPQDFVGGGGGKGGSLNLLHAPNGNGLGVGGLVTLDQGHVALTVPNLHLHGGSTT